MVRRKPFCITFAGPVGSSKTPIAVYLSCKLGLPIFNNDAIRSEVIEDLGQLKQNEYLKRRNQRAQDVIKRRIPFIYDASVDREWETLRVWLGKSDYQCFVISLDLSKKFFVQILNRKGYRKSLRRFEQLMSEHQKFVDKHASTIGLHITDKIFQKRLELSFKTVKKWIDN